MAASWLQARACAQKKEIHFHFPVLGHYFMHPDRVFGRIEKVIKKKKSAFAEPNEYIKILSKFGKIFNLGEEDVKCVRLEKIQ